ncbi:MAG: pyridoxal-dependent decarboxylase [Candidatus Thermoplasmatota archaeon]|nr:pyridoxal-dependent decarboxylase [Candidatus Thermoplasmatota archaeon]
MSMILKPSLAGSIVPPADMDEMLDMLHHKIKSYLAKDGDVVESIPHSSLSKVADLKLPLEGRGLESLDKDIDEFLRYSVNTSKPGFMNPLWGGFNISAFVGEVIATLVNNSMYTFELSPFATLIEQALIKRMCEIVGFSDGNGTLTTGGSSGNMLGMMCARYKVDPLGQQRGFEGTKLVCFVSEESHYSVLMSANVLGIGFDNVIKVKCDSDGRMRPDKLNEEIERSRINGQIPFCVVATSGTTVKGAFDPLKEISNICSDQDIWLHVDAAWGGSCMFSSKHRALMDGVELADSVCWDAHKMMGVPLVCSAFLIKQPNVLRKICSHGDIAHYLFLDDAKAVDLGRISLQCGRRNDALKLFLAWREKGDAGWARLIESYMELANYMETCVLENKHLELMAPREWTNLCIRFTSPGIDHDAVNRSIRKRIVASGKFMASQSTISDNIILRPVIANPAVTELSIKSFLDEVVGTGMDIIRNIPPKD